MAKDKFKKIQQSGGALSSFQDMVQQAATVAQIEKQAEPAPQPTEAGTDNKVTDTPPVAAPSVTPVRYARLPNPQIPITEVALVEQYCRQFDNMTKQDFVELAIIEKLHNDGDMSQDDFMARYEEIRSRLPRGHRKGTKTPVSK